MSFSSLEEFSKGDGVYVLAYSACDSTDLVLHRARAELGHAAMDILHMRCEQVRGSVWADETRSLTWDPQAHSPPLW